MHKKGYYGKFSMLFLYTLDKINKFTNVDLIIN